MRVYVLLPAYNEEQSIAPLFTSLAQFAQRSQCEIRPILVDDGSNDRTADVARDLGKALKVQVIQHGVNQGLGAGVNTSLRAACESANDEDVFVLLDCDNTHNPDHIPAMLELVSRGADVVIASRYAPGGKEIGLIPVRRVGSRIVSTLLKILFAVPGARDYTCGFRAYRAGVVRRGFEVYGDNLVTETSFVCMAELLVKLASVGARVEEVPLVLRYDLKGGASKMLYGRTLRRYAVFVLAQRKIILANGRATAANKTPVPRIAKPLAINP